MAATYLKSHKQADNRSALQSLKDRFDYGLDTKKLGAVSSYLCDPAMAHLEFMQEAEQYRVEMGREPGVVSCAIRSGKTFLLRRYFVLQMADQSRD